MTFKSDIDHNMFYIAIIITLLALRFDIKGETKMANYIFCYTQYLVVKLKQRTLWGLINTIWEGPCWLWGVRILDSGICQPLHLRIMIGG